MMFEANRIESRASAISSHTGTMQSTRRSFLCSLTAAAVAAPSVSAGLQGNGKRPNMLIIMADEFGAPNSTIGTAGVGAITSLLYSSPMRQIQLAMKLEF